MPWRVHEVLFNSEVIYKMNALVSIVIPTYNRAKDLQRAIKSVVSQTFTDWELIVVDNHSEDETDAVVGGFDDSRVKFLKIKNEGVIAASRNLGVSVAGGEYIAFLDSDDWWMPNKLERAVKLLLDGADVAYHPLYTVKKINQRFFFDKGHTRALSPPVMHDLIENGNALANSSVVIRRSLIEQVDGISEDRGLVSIEDYDLWLRISRLTDRFIMDSETLGYYWAGGGNVSSPKLALSALESLLEHYTSEVLLQGVLPVWMNYKIGRASYFLGDYERAKNHLSLIPISLDSLSVSIKSMLMRLHLKVLSL